MAGECWASVMTIPRLLSLAEDGTLRIEPVPELKALRTNPRHWADIQLTPDAEMHIEAVRGDCLELLVQIEPGTATEFGVKVWRSPDGTEETAISCLPGRGILKIDFSKSTLDDKVNLLALRGTVNPKASMIRNATPILKKRRSN